MKKIFLVFLFSFIFSTVLRSETPYDLAFQSFSAGQWDEAAKQIESAIKLDGNSSKTWILKGRICLGKKQFVEAEDAFKKALDVDDQAFEAYFFRGDASFAQRFWGEAADFYAKSTKKSADSRNAILKIIYCQIAAGELTEATRLLAKLDPFDKDHPGYYFARAALDRSMGSSSKAEASLKQIQTLYGNTVFNQYFPDYVWIFKAK